MAEAAFEALVERHGPMVLRVARSVLGNTHDAEDVFQATFLVLAERAGGVRRRDSIASWLFGVATRVATRARVDAARRLNHERKAAAQVVEAVTVSEGSLTGWMELHKEIDRLPERYRAVVVLCELQGCAQDEAARRLGCPPGTVRTRLARARQRLRVRLSRRGLGAIAALPGRFVLARRTCR